MHTKQPYRTQAERKVLGSMLLDPNCVPEVLNKLQPDDFSVRQNREIFLSIQSLNQCSAPVDAIMVLHKLGKTSSGDEQFYRTYLFQIMDETLTSADVDQYITQMLSLSGITPRASDGKGGESEPDIVRPPPNLCTSI